MPLPHVPRLEDRRLITGTGQYLDDVEPAGTLFMALARSPFAHARIADVDAAGARGIEGVRLVLEPDDVADLYVPPPARADRNIPRRPALAQGKVLMVGDPVVAVVADSRAAAADAAAAVFVDYEELAPVLSAEQGLDAAPIHPELESNVQIDRSRGDATAVDDLGGEIVLEGVVDHPRLVPNPLETRGCLAEWRGDQLTVHLSTQAPALFAPEIATAFGLPESRVRLVTPEVGGAFGSKFDLGQEEMLVIESARRLRRPVKWAESRREHFLTIGHGRSQRHRYKVVADAEGRVLGLYIDSLVDVGCRRRYLSGAPYTPPMGTGNYRISTYAWRQRVVFTNKAPHGIYRGAGRPEATLTIERIMDRVARAAGLDPAEVRRRNFVEEFPFTNPANVTYESGDYHRALDALLKEADYEKLKADREERRGAGRLVGIGLAAYVEATGFESYERATLEILEDGSVRVYVGTHDHGQGHRTVFAQIVARELGIEPSEVEVVQGDTAAVSYGFGTSGSRSIAQGGSAVFGAAQEAAAKLRRVAAHVLEAAEDQVELTEGVARLTEDHDRSLTFAEVVRTAYRPGRIPPGERIGIHVHHQFDTGGMNFPFGMHLAMVEVDRETGEVRLAGLWAVDDCGNVMNPMVVAGQRIGGMAQGVGQALWESVVYDENGNLLTGSFVDYLMPGAVQMPSPHLRHTVTRSPLNPLGVKGVAEAGAVGTPAAIANAVVDALSPLGVNHLDVPMHAPKVWDALTRA